MPKSHQDYESLAKSFNFKFIGPTPKNTRTKTTWMCRNMHTWEANYSNIRAGRGCPQCFAIKIASSRATCQTKYHEAALKLCWTWLGPYTVNARIKTGWQCENGHRFLASYRHVKHNGVGCQICAGKKTTDDVYYEYGENDVDYNEIALEVIAWVNPGKYGEKSSNSEIMELAGVNAGDMEVLKKYVLRNNTTAIDEIIKNVAEFVRVKHIFYPV